MTTIFMGTGSYADPDLPHTLHSAIHQSSGNHEIHISVLEQVTRYADAYLLDFDPPKHVRIDIGMVGDRLIGVGGARSMAEQKYDGEDIQIQIDSHSRFMDNWDEEVVHMIESAGPRSVISGMYSNPWQLLNRISVGVAEAYCEEGDCEVVCEKGYIRFLEPISGRMDELIPARTILPSGVMGTSWCMEVPTDPYIIFRGDGWSMAPRLWTSGFDLYGGRVPWYQIKSGEKSGQKAWERHNDWGSRDADSRRRIEAMITGKELPLEDPAGIDIDLYGLGNKRTIQEWIDYSGLDMPSRTIIYPWP